MEVLAIIPARGGSKGIPGKNLVPIKGKPMLLYSIEHALQSSLITRVVVSSDHEEIMEVAKDSGAEVPFRRPDALAEDHVLDWPVFDHAIRFLESSEGYKPDFVVHLRPTTPVRKPEWIDECVQLLIANDKADSVRSVSMPDEHPYRMFSIGENGFLDPIVKNIDRPYELRRQDHPAYFHYNCVIDVARYTTIIDKKSMTGDQILPFIMKPEEVVDVDTLQDLEIVKALYSNWL